MQNKFLQVALSVLLIAVVAVALGFASTPASAVKSTSPVHDDGGVITSPASLNLAATKPWTAAQMKAAKPYPMPSLDDAAAIAGDLTAGPTGPAGFAPGAKPGQSAASAAVEAMEADPMTGVSPLGYSYPAPFTRFHVGAISPYTTYPFSTVGKLFFRQYGVSYVCSASVIANKAIVTAGHCVHVGNNLASGWSTNVVFVPAYRNGVAPYGQWAVGPLITFTDWYANGNPGGFDHDWGAGAITALRLGKTIGQTVGYLGYAYNYSVNQNWWLLGYPQAAPFNGAYMYACNTSFAYYSPFYSGGPAPMTVGCDQTGGTSGGPWIKNFGSYNYVNSVNSHRANNQPLSLAGPYADTATYTGIFYWARTR